MRGEMGEGEMGWGRGEIRTVRDAAGDFLHTVPPIVWKESPSDKPVPYL